MIGQAFGHYRIVEKIGAGGMGVVYRAHDLQLDRDAALKVLPPTAQGDEAAHNRFRHEARALSRLNHPNICTIYEVGEDHGQTYIAMEYVEGQPLGKLLSGKGLPLEAAVRYGMQIADALAHAHERGIVHRDLKSSNVVITPDGRAKVLDFGLAKQLARQHLDEAFGSTESLPMTQPGTVAGTLHYMSPEVLRGEPAGHGSDLWALGVVLYEMLAGRLPFRGGPATAIIASIVGDKPQPLSSLRPDLPPELEKIVARAMEKDVDARYRSALEMRDDLAAVHAALSAPAMGLINVGAVARQMKRPRVAVPVLLVLVLLAVLVAWVWRTVAAKRWAINQALPEIAALVEKEDWQAAFNLARQAEQYIPDDARLAEMWPQVSRDASVETTPPGAGVYIKPYAAVSGEWHFLGQSPIAKARIPRSYLRWKITKPGFQPLEAAPAFIPAYAPPTLTFNFTLDKSEGLPPEMVRVPDGGFPRLPLTGLDHFEFQLGDYFIDKYEVSNREYKAFVDQGGYQKSEYWKHAFVKNGRPLSWQEGMAELRDATGRPGPSTWELGTYPEGQGDFPVSGVSWYEAAAYAEFAGKSLPTIFHWGKASGVNVNIFIVPLSNFRSVGTAPRGKFNGMNPFGTYDMAGNVKEWCWNESARGSNKRYILGGGFGEPVYMFNDPDAQDAFTRLPTYGFRCVKYLSDLPDSITAPVEHPRRDYAKEKPASEETFRIYERFYAYDRTDLNPAVEATDESPPHWRKLKVTFNAAYGTERVPAYLLLPKNAQAPYQAVVYFPPSTALRQRSSETLYTAQLEFLVRSGRAVIYPVYKSTYERGDGLTSDRPNTTSWYRDHVIQWVKDCSRSIDYLETRTDIDRNKIAYYGVSWGGVMGAIIPAVEKRLKVAVFVVGGLFQQQTVPEVEQINFAPRVKIPVLMLNGRHDFVFPVDTSQLPMFRFLGTPDQDKRHVLFDTGHSVPRNELIKETLAWLDRYLGPVS